MNRSTKTSLYVNLFAYGSLRMPRLMTYLTGKRFDSMKACLSGYSCHFLAGKPFPGLCHQSDHTTHGMMHLRVSRRTLRKLDRFENDFYRRVSCHVVITGLPTMYPVSIYELKMEYLKKLTPKPWNAAHFKLSALYARLTRKLPLQDC